MRALRYLVVFVTLLSGNVSFATTAYDIDFKLMNALQYDSLDLRINYSAANGGFTGSGETVSCTPNAALNALMVFNDASPVLKVGAMKTTGFTGPAVLLTCIFDSNSGAPSAGNFSITVTGWTSPSTSTAPTIQISGISVH